jgi:isopentenyl-diphosphate delta-isomerase type 1
MTEKAAPEEIIEIVTAGNEVIGQERRSVVHQSGQWHRGVHLFLFDARGRLLVQQRSKNRAQFPSTLDCSVSEHVKPGECYLHAAYRGLQEELGAGPLTLRRLVQFRMNYGPGDNMISELYEGSIAPAAVSFDAGEIEQISYFDLDRLLLLLESREIAFSPWFAQLLRWYAEKPSALDVLWNIRSSFDAQP